MEDLTYNKFVYKFWYHIYWIRFNTLAIFLKSILFIHDNYETYNYYMDYLKCIIYTADIISKYRASIKYNEFSYKELFLYLLKNDIIDKSKANYELFSFLLINELATYESDHKLNRNCKIFDHKTTYPLYKYCSKADEKNYEIIKNRLKDDWRK